MVLRQASLELLRVFNVLDKVGFYILDLLSLSFFFSISLLRRGAPVFIFKSPSSSVFLTSLFASLSICFSLMKLRSTFFELFKFSRGDLFSLLRFDYLLDCLLDFYFYCLFLSNESSLFVIVKRGDCIVVIVAVAKVEVG